MSTLFDITPDEPVRSKGKRKTAPAVEPPAAAVAEPAFRPPVVLDMPIGTIDHTYQCLDAACQAECSDILYEEGRQWYIECAFCGTGQWVPVIRGHITPKEQEFVFRDGRFAGLTVSQAFAQPRGKDYVEWAASSHPREVVKKACKGWLDSRRSAE